jgi:DNA-binding NarL/FixJ family response regulator
MTRSSAVGPSLNAVVIYHRDSLAGAAAAAVLERRGVARVATAVTSHAALLSKLHFGIDVVVVFGGGAETREFFQALGRRGLAVPVLMVVDRLDPECAAEALEWGAAGVIPSSCPPLALCGAVLGARAGRVVLPDEIRGDVYWALHTRREQRSAAQHRLAGLRPAELRVLSALAEGLSVAQISERMVLSPHTIRSHLRSIGSKLGVRGQLRLAVAGRDLLRMTGGHAGGTGLWAVGADRPLPMPGSYVE